MITKKEVKELLQKGESDSLDWKENFPPGLIKGKRDPKWDEGRAKLLKSLIALANGDGFQNAYLVYGVKDLGYHREVVGISNTFDDANFQTWAENIFDPHPSFIYTEIEIELESAKRIGVFKIKRTPDYPHVIKSNMDNILYKGQVWFRRGSKNTIALRADLERMFLGHKPFKIAKLSDPVLNQIIEDYKSQGRETNLPSLAERDSLLARGYELARYPGTRREIWVGNVVGDRYDHILVLKPKL